MLLKLSYQILYIQFLVLLKLIKLEIVKHDWPKSSFLFWHEFYILFYTNSWQSSLLLSRSIFQTDFGGGIWSCSFFHQNIGRFFTISASQYTTHGIYVFHNKDYVLEVQLHRDILTWSLKFSINGIIDQINKKS